MLPDASVANQKPFGITIAAEAEESGEAICATAVKSVALV